MGDVDDWDVVFTIVNNTHYHGEYWFFNILARLKRGMTYVKVRGRAMTPDEKRDLYARMERFMITQI